MFENKRKIKVAYLCWSDRVTFLKIPNFNLIRAAKDFF